MRRALVLSGGGAHGAYEGGVIAGLADAGALDDYDIVCGTSIGALNAALVASGQGAAVRTLWSTIAQRDILRPRPEFGAFDRRSSAVARGVAALRFVYGAVRGRVRGFVDPAPLSGLIASYVLASNGAAKAFVRPLLWAVTDLTSTCGAAFVRDAAPASGYRLGASVLPSATRIPDAALVASLQASAAIPGVFDPMAIPGSDGLYVDGGVRNNTPFDLARGAGATHIDTVLLTRSAGGPAAYPNALAVVEASYAMMRGRLLEDAIRDTLARSDSDSAQLSPALRLIAPSSGLAGSGFDARDQGLIDTNFDLGYNDLRRHGFRPATASSDCSGVSSGIGAS